MEEKYYEILRHYVNPNDCATVVKQLLSLHNVVGQSEQFYCYDSSKDGGYKPKCDDQCDYCRRICPKQ